MDREDIKNVCHLEVLDTACELYGMKKADLTLVPGYEGCANLVYECNQRDSDRMLRISFRPDRTAAQISAELHYVNYLAEHGVGVAAPLPSIDGRLVEAVQVRDITLHLVSFVRGKGMRVPDNAYRYRVDVPIEEYFQDWGRMLGQMHHLAKSYLPKNNLEVRPDWFELHSAKSLYEEQMEESLPTVHSKIQAFWLELQALQRDDNSYGLIHGDFNDGNFTIDYENGDMTVFDFDDCCYFWFAYELGSAWEGGIGRTMFQGLKKRQAFMKHYMEQVLEGYDRENSLSADWLSRLPMFIRLIQIEEFLHFFQYIDDNEDEEGQAELAYRIKCIEDDIPYMGFFDTIYSPAKPFSL